MQPILFVDLSYYSICLYYKVKHYLSYQGIQPDEETPGLSIPEFKEKFDELFHKNIQQFIGKREHSIPDSNVFFVKDSVEHTWRDDLHTTYKGNRAPLQLFDATVLEHCSQMAKEWNLLSLPNTEADDIIGVLHKHIRNKEPQRYIYIITDDNDYLQLLDDYTTISNLKDTKTKTIHHRSEGNHRVDVIKKALMGDASDNIPQSAPRIGPKTASRLAWNHEERERRLEKNPSMLSQFEHNLNLIDMDRIPQNIQRKIIDKLAGKVLQKSSSSK